MRDIHRVLWALAALSVINLIAIFALSSVSCSDIKAYYVFPLSVFPPPVSNWQIPRRFHNENRNGI